MTTKLCNKVGKPMYGNYYTINCCTYQDGICVAIYDLSIMVILQNLQIYEKLGSIDLWF
jgi:hypothetical protein